MLKLFVAIAPVIYNENASSKFMKKMNTSHEAPKAAKMMGPEVLMKSWASNPLKSAATNSFIGRLINYQSLGQLSDSDPLLIDQNGYKNYCKFYPAGVSIKTLLHFR